MKTLIKNGRIVTAVDGYFESEILRSENFGNSFEQRNFTRLNRRFAAKAKKIPLSEIG